MATTTSSAMTVNRGALTVCGAVATLIFASGCGTEARNEPAPALGAQDRGVLYSHVWSADPGIDLLGRGAELIRATYEAGNYATFVGLEDSYPGFGRAVGGEAHHTDPDIEYFMTSRTVESDTQAEGTSFGHITAYQATETSVAATVCHYYLFPESGTNISLNPLKMAFRIQLERAGADAGQAGIPDTDPARKDPRAHRVPTWNVFGDWKITRLHYLRQLNGDVIPQGCTDWWRQQFPNFSPNAGGNLVPPPGFEPPTMPVAVQYPEWIGPATPE
ncbi:hypothetical protein [Rhodococcus sp. WAY2]|uniref:hypothetical protein n=1 Tax=Rhodococcus sp. WAY2 TaxID=2663121 RepID=UPI00135BF567|nr:hypothetical protein [Rhodococcus sp. WAY2]